MTKKRHNPIQLKILVTETSSFIRVRTEYEAKIQLFGISERLNLSETPTGSKQKAEWSFGSSEQPLK